MDGWIIQGFFTIVHGQRPWTTSLSSIHGQRPWTTLLSSKGDLVSYSSHSRSVTFRSLLGWFLIQFALLDMDDPYGRIGNELIFRYPIIHYTSEGLSEVHCCFYISNQPSITCPITTIENLTTITTIMFLSRKEKKNENLSVKYKYFYKHTTQNLFIIHKQIK